MEFTIRVPRRLLVAGAAGAVLVGGAGIAYASVPDAKGIIHGCRDKSSGALRVIDTGKKQKCKKTETALDWNQKGARGPAGPAAIPGFERINKMSAELQPGQRARLEIRCSPGKVTLSGGYYFSGDFMVDTNATSWPDINIWIIQAYNRNNYAPTISGFAVCATGKSPYSAAGTGTSTPGHLSPGPR